MKKFFIIAAAVFMTAASSNAQFLEKLKEHDIFNHLGVGVGVGTTGISIEAGTTITPWVQFRAGVDIMPSFKLSTEFGLERFDVADHNVGYSLPEVPDEIDVEGKLTNTLGHILFDVFPFTNKSSFHVTVGAYFGGSKLISAYNTNSQSALKDVYMFNNRLGKYSSSYYDGAGKIGAELGDYFIEPNSRGEIEAAIKVFSFRPYFGIGFGRIVPKSRINCLFDLGVQVWGSPSVWNETNKTKLLSENTDGNDGGIIKTISKISVYPVLNIKIVGRIF